MFRGGSLWNQLNNIKSGVRRYVCGFARVANARSEDRTIVISLYLAVPSSGESPQQDVLKGACGIMAWS